MHSVCMCVCAFCFGPRFYHEFFINFVTEIPLRCCWIKYRARKTWCVLVLRCTLNVVAVQPVDLSLSGSVGQRTGAWEKYLHCFVRDTTRKETKFSGEASWQESRREEIKQPSISVRTHSPVCWSCHTQMYGKCLHLIHNKQKYFISWWCGKSIYAHL